jgi:hypothetical protein
VTAVDVEQPLRLCEGQPGIEAEWRRLPGDEPGTTRAQDGLVEAWGGHFQPQDLWPIHAAADGSCGLTIRAAFHTRQDRGQRQTPWRVGGLAACGETRSQRCVVVDGAETVGDRHRDVPAREHRTGHPLGCFRDWRGGVGVS